jgi:hypothetical protein
MLRLSHALSLVIASCLASVPHAKNADRVQSAMRRFAPSVDRTPSAIRVTWTPSLPRQGMAIAVLLSEDSASAADSIVSVRGELAGEPLHFERRSDGTRRAMAGLPVDAAAKIQLPLVVLRASGARDSVSVSIPVTKGSFDMEPP